MIALSMVKWKHLACPAMAPDEQNTRKGRVGALFRCHAKLVRWAAVTRFAWVPLPRKASERNNQTNAKNLRRPQALGSNHSGKFEKGTAPLSHPGLLS
jgi:hypothetical protein